MTSTPTVEERELAVLDGLATSLTETRAAIASLQAFEFTLLAAAETLAEEQTSRLVSADSRERELPRRSIAAEIGTATRTSDRTVQRRMSDAVTLTRDFPATTRALGAGTIDRAHVTVIVDTGAPLTDPAARADFETAAIALAQRETPGRLRPLLRTLAARLDPASIDTRHATAVQQRGVWVTDLDDGMAQLVATLPAAIAHAIRDRLTRFAHTIIGARPPAAVDADQSTERTACATEPAACATAPTARADAAADAGGTADTDAGGAGGDARAGGVADPEGPDAGGTADTDAGGAADTDATPVSDRRTMEHLRADVLADLLLTADPTAAPRSAEPIVATVQVIVPALTLLDANTTPTDPAELVGHTPIDTATARCLTGTATGWDRLLTHPITGSILTVDRYRPSEHQRRYLRARDEHCRFPGCRMPVHRCDIDHTVDAAHGGPTTTCNLAHLCRRHHTLKHHTDWTVTQHPDGTLAWTSPTGRTHHDHPPSTVRFRASTDPPPS